MGGLLQKKPGAPPPFAGDPLLPGVRAQFLKGDTKQLERLLSLDSAEDRYFFAKEIVEGLPRENVERWAEQQPDNPAACWLRACHGPVWAWDARSAAVASQVTAGQWAEFARRLEISRKDVETFRRLRPQDPNGLAMLLIVAKGENLTLQERTAIYDELHRLDPQHYPGARNYLDAILKKWGGSHEMALDFAMRSMRGAPPGSSMGGLVLAAMVEEWLCRMAFDGDPDGAADFCESAPVLELTQEAYTCSLGSQAFVETAFTVHLRNETAFWLYLTGAAAALKVELARLGKRVTRWPWCYMGEPGKIYADARKYAGLR